MGVYQFFNSLAFQVASIVATKRPPRPPGWGPACNNLESITEMRSFDYPAELEDFRQTREQNERNTHHGQKELSRTQGCCKKVVVAHARQAA